MKNDLTQESIKEVLRYDAENGKFVRLRNGREPGTIDKDGYRVISIGRHFYGAHRLAWLYAKGEWPKGVIDHINGKRDDNRLVNLRDATRAENSHNQRTVSAHNKSSAAIGVSWQPSRGRWMASIQVEGKTKYIGRFKTEEEAADAYFNAKRIYHPSAPLHKPRSSCIVADND